MSLRTLTYGQLTQTSFLQKKSNVAKCFFDIFNAEVAQCCQKLDFILGTKVVQFWSYQKMYFTKNVVLNWYSSMKFFFRKIRTFFDIENWLWKSDLGTFWRPMWTSVKVKSKNYFYFTDFFAKIKPLLTHVYKTPPLRSH